MKRRVVAGAFVILATVGGLASCSSQDDGALDSAEQPIRNGIPFDDAEALGMVAIKRLGGEGKLGSGSFLSPEWILTAGHVVDLIQMRPQEILVTLGSPNVLGPQRRAAAIYVHPAHTRQGGSAPGFPSEVDVALIRLESPFDADPFIWKLSSSPKATLLNKLVDCQGYGLTVEGDANSSGTLTFAEGLRVSFVGTNFVRVNERLDPLHGPQIFLPGDSGGNCNLPNLDIAGVISTSDTTPPSNFGHIVPVDSFRDWAASIMSGCSNGTPGAAGFCSATCPCQYGTGDCNNSAGCAFGMTCDSNVGFGFGLSGASDVCVPSSCATGILGNSGYCSGVCPCGQGGGDCNSNADCQDGLVCDSNVGPAFRMSPGSDVCVAPQCSLRTLGADDFCSPDCPCGHGGGDCESAADCLPGLTCAQNFGAAFGYKGVTDVCMPASCAVGPFTANGFCTEACPCGHGGGDCDSDAECMPGLLCGTDNGATFGQAANWDHCVRP